MDDRFPFEMTVDELSGRRKAREAHCLLDVREPWELDLCRFEGSLDIPLDELAGRVDEIPVDLPVIVVCHHGQRSANATQWLRANGRPAAINLRGGIDAWARRIDETMPIY